jgi:hypothetical protein
MLPFNDKELSDLKSKLAAIAARPVHWNETKIKNWGGMASEAKKMDATPEWWKRDQSGSSNLASINELLEGRGLGRLRSRDDKESENVHAGERGVTASQVSEYQHNKEKNLNASASKNREEHADDQEEYLSFMPKPHDILSKWYSDLGVHVDINKESRSPWFSALGSYIGKFPATAKLADVDRETVATLLKQICEGAHANE